MVGFGICLTWCRGRALRFAARRVFLPAPLSAGHQFRQAPACNSTGEGLGTVGTGSPHRAGHGHQQPHQVNTVPALPLPAPATGRTAAPAPASNPPGHGWRRASGWVGGCSVANGGLRCLPCMVQGPCPRICSAKGVPARPLIGGPPVQVSPGLKHSTRRRAGHRGHWITPPARTAAPAQASKGRAPWALQTASKVKGEDCRGDPVAA